MSNREVHSRTGANIGLVEYERWIETQGRPPSLLEAFLCLVVGSRAAELPDDIEPGNNPNHRGIAHSFELNLILSRVMGDLSLKEPQGFSDLLCRIGVEGYKSHLSLDQKTPMGLHSVIGDMVERLLKKIAG